MACIICFIENNLLNFSSQIVAPKCLNKDIFRNYLGVEIPGVKKLSNSRSSIGVEALEEYKMSSSRNSEEIENLHE